MSDCASTRAERGPATLDVALATCARLPEPDPDAELLADALRAGGLSAEWLAWDDPVADFSRARLTLLRSTWNYPTRPAEFAAWAERTASVSALWNPLPVVRWNLHKGYLLELARQGIPIVPTELVPSGSSEPLRSIARRRGWSDVVVKPAVSAASFATVRVDAETMDSGERHLRQLATERDVLVQRYLSSVEDHGERALVWVDGVLTHAVRKSPRFAGEVESVTTAAVAPAERDCASRAIAAVGHPLLYARADLAPGADGAPCIMELELIEPSLFFAQGPHALERLVGSLQRVL